MHTFIILGLFIDPVRILISFLGVHLASISMKQAVVLLEIKLE